MNRIVITCKKAPRSFFHTYTFKDDKGTVLARFRAESYEAAAKAFMRKIESVSYGSLYEIEKA